MTTRQAKRRVCYIRQLNKSDGGRTNRQRRVRPLDPSSAAWTKFDRAERLGDWAAAAAAVVALKSRGESRSARPTTPSAPPHLAIRRRHRRRRVPAPRPRKPI
uniref:Uncharacterized protein n=1 Tax=Plectus sambesii TaxID=2011161 RepID=A0A914XIR8_9BILA